MTLDLPTLRLIAAVVLVPVLVLALYRRVGRVVSFQRNQLVRGGPLATARVTTAATSGLLLVVIGIAGAVGAAVKVVYALLLILGASVLAYLVLTGAAGFLEGKTRHDRSGGA
jgi:hypothetical protein